jgi:DNA mismatch endonuclease Vsr
MDKHTPEQRRKNMQAVKNKDSQIELLLRRELWSRGLRYRKNVNRIYGKPDIVFIGKRSPFSVIANFGTDTVGKSERKILSHTKNFGYRRLNETWRGMPK